MCATIQALLTPSKLWSRSEALARPSPIPSESGVYAWFFRNLPPSVPRNYAPRFNGLHLLYVGISPAHDGSSNNLRKRIRAHFKGNASSSTLRLTLGCLLHRELGLRLRPTGTTGRLTYADGEATLSEWLEDNALLTWVRCLRPWTFERKIIHEISPLLNLQHNESSPFHAWLSEIRRLCKSNARSFPSS
jgi:hypothetical protein